MPTTYSREKVDYYRKREELRDSLSKKYQKQFGPKYQSIIFSEVDKYVINSRFSDEEINKLEQSISERIAESNQKKPSIISHEPDLKYNIKQSSQRIVPQQDYQQDNFKLPNINNNSTLNHDNSNAQIRASDQHKSSSSVVGGTYNPFQDVSNYHGIKSPPKNNDWSKLQDYKSKLIEKDLEHEKEIANRKKELMKQTFDEQFREKDEILQRERMERQKYIEQQNQQYQDYVIDEEIKKKELLERALKEKEERKKQAEDSRNRRTAEQEKEKHLAKKMAEQIETQYKTELAEENERKRREKTELMNFILSNDEKLREKQIQHELDRKKEIELMKEQALMEEQRERQRVEENNKRLAMISERLNIVMESDSIKEQQKRMKQEEESRKKAIENKERIDFEKERNERELREKRIQEDQVELSRQVLDRKMRKQAERDEEKKYYQSFIEQNKKEIEKERELDKLRRQQAIENAKFLQLQMNQPKTDLDDMSKRELDFNRQILSKATNGAVSYQPGLKL